MNKITKTSIASSKFDVLNENEVEELSLTTTENGAEIAASGNIELTTRDAAASISMRTAKVQIPTKLETGDISAERLEANVAHVDDLTVGEHIYATDIEADNISLEGNLNFYPKIEGGRANTPIALHNAIYDLTSIISELSAQDSRSFNTLSVVAALTTPGVVDGKDTGSLVNFASVTADRIVAAEANIPAITADSLSLTTLSTGTLTTEQANITAAKITGNLTCKNIQSTGNLSTTGTIITSSRLTASELRTETIRAEDSDVGITIMGADNYSYIWQSYAGLTVKNTQDIKFELDQLNGYKNAISITTQDGITLKENNITISHAASRIHALLQLDNSLADLATIEQQIQDLQTEVNDTLDQSYLTTLLTVPTSEGNFEIAQLSTRELPAGTGLNINRIIIEARNTNTTPLYISVWAVKSGAKTLLSVSDEPIAWTAGEKAEWRFDSSPFTIAAGLEYLTLQLIIEKNAPDTVVTSSQLQMRTFIAPTGYSNCRSQGGWNNGRTPYVKLAGYGAVGQLVEDMQTVQGKLVELYDTTAALTQKDVEFADQFTSLMSHVDTIDDTVIAHTTRINALSSEVSALKENAGSGEGVSGDQIVDGTAALKITENDALHLSGVPAVVLSNSVNTLQLYNNLTVAYNSTDKMLLAADRISINNQNDKIEMKNGEVLVRTNRMLIDYDGVGPYDIELDTTNSTMLARYGRFSYTNHIGYDGDWWRKAVSYDSDLALTLGAWISGMTQLETRHFDTIPVLDRNPSTIEFSLLAYNNCITDLGVLPNVGSPIKILNVELYGDINTTNQLYTTSTIEAEVWYATNSSNYTDFVWPDTVKFISSVPDLSQPNTRTRLKLRREPDGTILCWHLYSYEVD